MRRGHLPGKNTHANQQESAQEHTEVYGRSKIHEGDGIKQRSTATSARQEAEPPNFSLIQITLTTWLFLFSFIFFFSSIFSFSRQKCPQNQFSLFQKVKITKNFNSYGLAKQIEPFHKCYNFSQTFRHITP